MDSRARERINFRSNSGVDLPSFPGLLSFHDHSVFLSLYPSATRSRASLCDHRKVDGQIVRDCVEDYVN